MNFSKIVKSYLIVVLLLVLSLSSFGIYYYWKLGAVNVDNIIDGAIVGMLNELDPHSNYIPSNDLEKINEQFDGKFEGIGIEFDILDNYITVI